jgi:hypothetical protein
VHRLVLSGEGLTFVLPFPPRAAACHVATIKKQAIGEVMEWASGGTFK